MQNFKRRLSIGLAVPLVFAATVAVLAFSSPGGSSSPMSGMTGSSAGAMSDMPGMGAPSATTPSRPVSLATASDVDEAFARQMVAHLRADAQAAKTASRLAKQPTIRRLAASMETDLRTQLRAVRRAAPADPETPTATRAVSADAATLALSEQTLAATIRISGDSPDFDRAFVLTWSSHHVGALKLAQVQLQRGGSTRLKRAARSITQGQAVSASQLRKRDD